MEEFNKKTLIEALSSLKEHEPPEFIWDRIDLQLEEAGEELVSKKMLQNLPVHEPPAEVWQNIVKKLNRGRGAKIVLIGWRKALAVAASLAILLAAYFTFKTDLPTAPEEAFTVTYSTEEMDDNLFAKDWKEDEAAFEEFEELCDVKKYVCEQPEFQSLKDELNELTAAIGDLETAIGQYGTNADLILQIKNIELERTDILKKMMVMLI
ncbi:MAG TPA: hypothetical protein ENJ95_00980 [Bacteroidetes bacterium]|nr:hypothetical protein [Bacteroidota bacterium]